LRKGSAWLRPILILAGAAATAALFRYAQLPLPYILGALVGSALVSNLFGPMQGGRYLRRTGQLVVGAAVGGVLTPEVLAELARLLPLMLAVGVAANLAGALLALPIAWIAGVDRLTGLLACLPAGMAEMASFARDLGADEQTVAVIHTLRVILVVTLIPLWLGAAGSPPPLPVPTLPDLAMVGLVLAAGTALAVAAVRLGVLNPWVIAPMLLCLVASIAGARIPPIPAPLLILAQIGIGASLGLRFRVAQLRRLPRAAAAGVVSGLLLTALSFACFAPLVAAFGGLSREASTLGVMPGGLGEMIAVASALGLLPATVAGFQITRSILTNVVAPQLIRVALPRRAGTTPRRSPALSSKQGPDRSGKGGVEHE